MISRRVFLSLAMVLLVATVTGCKGRVASERRERPQEPSARTEEPKTPPPPCQPAHFGSFPALRGLESVAVKTRGEYSDYDLDMMKLTGIGDGHLRSVAEAYLQAKGLTIDDDPDSLSKGRPTIEVSLTHEQAKTDYMGRPTHIRASLRFRLYRTVVIDGLDCWCMAPVWERTLTSTTSRKDTRVILEQAFDKYLEVFWHDWLKANPKE